MARLSDESIAALKAAHPLDALIEQRVRLGRANAKGIRAGQCLCAPVKGKAPLWCNGEAFGCLKPSGCGGDIFAYLESFEGLDFRAAVERLGGVDCAADPELLARAKAERDAAKARRAAELAAQAERERVRAYEIWKRGVPAAGTLADAYFRHRGLDPLATPSLRFSAAEPYYAEAEGPNEKPMLVHRGPCLLAAIQAPDGRFCGLHRTWLDLATPSGKAEIRAPGGALLPPKKMRGIKKRGAIRLVDVPPGDLAPAERVLVVGEGIETVLTAWQVLFGVRRRGVAYYAWAAGDLGNMSGGTLGPAAPHPTRPGVWIPSREPDPADPGLEPPAWATRAILLGDGDSDPDVTRARLACAKARFEADGCPADIRMAPAGKDFNDLVRRAS